MAEKDCTDFQVRLARVATGLVQHGRAKDLDQVLTMMSGVSEVPPDFKRQVIEAIHEYYYEAPRKRTKKVLTSLESLQKEADKGSAFYKRIDSLKSQISTGKWEDSPAKKRRIGKELAALKKEAARLGKKLKLDDIIAKKKAQLESGQFDPPAPREPLSDQQLESRELSKQIQRARKETPEGIAARKATALEQVAELENLIRTVDKDNIPASRVPKRLKTDAELDRINAEKALLRRQLNLKIEGLQHSGLKSAFIEANKFSRVMMTMGDLSATFRQGGIAALSHPKLMAGSGIPNMLTALKSKDGLARIERELENIQNYDLSRAGGLSVGSAKGIEEFYDSKWVRKLPGAKQAADISERAFTSYIETMRLHLFNSMYYAAGGPSKVDMEGVERIAKMANVFTGVGTSKSQMIQQVMNAHSWFFAPKWMLSRFQFLYEGMKIPVDEIKDVVLRDQHAKQMRSVRRAVAREYARYAAGLSVVAGMVIAMGGEMEKDPRSSDFGKVKFGNSRFDLASGLAQPIVLTSRLVSGKTKSSVSGEITSIRGDDVPYGKPDAAEIASRFVRGKSSPAVSAILDLAAGKNIVGEDADILTVAGSRIAPLSLASMYEQMKEYGVPKGAALSLLEMLGVSLQTYESRAKEVGEDQAYKELFDIDLDLDLDLDLGLD